MKNALSLAVFVSSLLAAVALADDGSVPQSTLKLFGMGDMVTLSNAKGMEVRGRSSGASTMGVSIVSGFIIDPATENFIFGSSSNAAAASSESAWAFTVVDPVHTTASSVNLSLTVGNFSGTLIGGSGGSGIALPQ